MLIVAILPYFLRFRDIMFRDPVLAGHPVTDSDPDPRSQREDNGFVNNLSPRRNPGTSGKGGGGVKTKKDNIKIPKSANNCNSEGSFSKESLT